MVSTGRVFSVAEANSVDLHLADTSVVTHGGALYRVVTIEGDGTTRYVALLPEQEETVISNAAKDAKVKPSFTRWLNMVRQGLWPDGATPAERALFGSCMLSDHLVSHRIDAKRKRDAMSRRKRHADGDVAPAKVAKVEVQKPDAAGAHIKIEASGPGSEVIALLRQLVNAASHS